MKIDFLDVGFTYREAKEEIDSVVSEVLKSGLFVGGQHVSDFERDFSSYVGAKHCVGVGNGLDAITLCLRALGVGRGDEVIVSSHTFVATWLAITSRGATVIPVDTSKDDFNLDIKLIEAKITERTRAIMVVHLYGVAVDLEQVNAVAKKYSIPVIEDAAQAHGSLYKGRRVGSHSDLIAWSFYPGKNLGAFGDAGAVTTNNEHFADQIRILGNYGSREKYVHELLGTNSRLDTIQAAVLRTKLKHLTKWNNQRQGIANQYHEELESIDLMELPQRSSDSCWHLFVVQTRWRDELRQFLNYHGIGTGIHYPIPPHQQTPYRDLFVEAHLPRTEALSKTILSLPIGPHLNPSQISEVSEYIRCFFKNELPKER